MSGDTLRLIPIPWEDVSILRELALEQQTVRHAELTILHTNDLHSALDGRQGSDGKTYGGLARIATTLRQARSQGPTLVCDVGDLVFGPGSWLDAQGAGDIARLRHAAGCDIATIGNHDLERGPAGLWELLDGGYPLVSTNLHFTDQQLQARIHPAYIAQIAGWNVGIIGLTTMSTLDLVPGRILQGITFADPLVSASRIINALEPYVDIMLVLSHLGFYEEGSGDCALAAHLAGSKVVAILGGHTHTALLPAPVIAGISVCNAGAYGANVGEVRLKRNSIGTVMVRTQLLPQVASIPPDEHMLEERSAFQQRLQPLQETRFTLPQLPPPSEEAFNRDRERILLAKAIFAVESACDKSILFIPFLYLSGTLPAGSAATLADLMTTYANIEEVVEAEMATHTLKTLIAQQPSLLYYQQARPFWLGSEREVLADELEDGQTYKVFVTELVCERGLGWTITQSAILAQRTLKRNCLQIVIDYLQTQEQARNLHQ